jgi:hypothetical protein
MPETRTSASRSFELPQGQQSDCDQKNLPGQNVGFDDFIIFTHDGAP